MIEKLITSKANKICQEESITKYLFMFLAYCFCLAFISSFNILESLFSYWVWIAVGLIIPFTWIFNSPDSIFAIIWFIIIIIASPLVDILKYKYKYNNIYINNMRTLLSFYFVILYIYTIVISMIVGLLDLSVTIYNLFI